MMERGGESKAKRIKIGSRLRKNKSRKRRMKKRERRIGKRSKEERKYRWKGYRKKKE